MGYDTIDDAPEVAAEKVAERRIAEEAPIEAATEGYPVIGHPEPKPKRARKRKVRVLVIGSADSVHDDLAQIDRADFDHVIGCNQAALDHGPVDFHVTLHPEKFGPKKAAHLVAWRNLPGVDEVFNYRWPGVRTGRSGSSGLYAVKYALERLGADEVVLAGVTMDVAPHYYDSEPWKAAEIQRDVWRTVAPAIRGKVTSLSGWTRELLRGN